MKEKANFVLQLVVKMEGGVLPVTRGDMESMKQNLEQVCKFKSYIYKSFYFKNLL